MAEGDEEKGRETNLTHVIGNVKDKPCLIINTYSVLQYRLGQSKEINLASSLTHKRECASFAYTLSPFKRTLDIRQRPSLVLTTMRINA